MIVALYPKKCYTLIVIL